jgi:hypothetical protein
MTYAELHELAALLDSLMSQAGRFTAWSMPGDGQVREGPGIDVTGSNRVGIGYDSILLADNTADTAAREYTADASGMTLALAAATSGDVLFLPARSISGNYTITAGVSVVGYSRYATKLTGQITMAASATVENLTIVRTANDASTYKAVINQASGTSYIHSCDIKVEQSGSGAAYAISLDGAGSLELWQCYVYGNSGSGNGYAWFDGGGGGNVYQYGGRAYGSTATEG